MKKGPYSCVCVCQFSSHSMSIQDAPIHAPYIYIKNAITFTHSLTLSTTLQTVVNRTINNNNNLLASFIMFQWFDVWLFCGPSIRPSSTQWFILVHFQSYSRRRSEFDEAWHVMLLMWRSYTIHYQWVVHVFLLCRSRFVTNTSREKYPNKWVAFSCARSILKKWIRLEYSNESREFSISSHTYYDGMLLFTFLFSQQLLIVCIFH